MKTHFFLRRIGIQFAPEYFEPRDYMVRLSFLCTFEGHVFPKMSQSLLMGLLIAASDVEHNTAVGNLRVRYLFVGNPNSVRQCVNLIIFHPYQLTRTAP